MAYNKINKLKRDLIIIEITNRHYEAGYTTYAAIFRKHIEPIYPMSYKSYMDIINSPDVEKRIKREIDKIKGSNQTKLFE